MERKDGKQWREKKDRIEKCGKKRKMERGDVERKDRMEICIWKRLTGNVHMERKE